MKYQVTLNTFETKEHFPDHWTTADFYELLDRCGYEDAPSVPENELREMLFLAMSDMEPDEAARLLLHYKLSEELNEGQIEQISHEMLEDKISEEYANIALHCELFHINSLLYKAFNGTFPNAKASIIEFDMKPIHGASKDIDREAVLKALNNGLTERSVLKRLFEEQLGSDEPFPDAEGILWELKNVSGDTYQIVTSEYWLNKDDFSTGEFEGEVREQEEDS